MLLHMRVVALATAGILYAGCGGTPTGSPARTDAGQPSGSLSPVAPSPSPAGGLPVFTADEPLMLLTQITNVGGGIFVSQPDGSGRTQLATDVLPGVHKRGAWSPDGQHVVFIDETTGRMWIANLDGSPTVAVSTCDAPGCDYPTWSPDGTRIAYSRAESGPGVGPPAVGIEVVDLTSGAVTKVIRLERPELADDPSWSPDGTQLVFQIDRLDDEANETGAAIAIVAADGGEPRVLTPFELFAGSPDWGWVTDEIVFTEALRGFKRVPDPGDETWNIFAIRPDGTGLRQVTHVETGRRLVAATWTPDGTRIASKEYDDVAVGGRFVHPETGAVEVFPTSELYTAPLPRPLTSAP